LWGSYIQNAWQYAHNPEELRNFLMEILRKALKGCQLGSRFNFTAWRLGEAIKMEAVGD